MSDPRDQLPFSVWWLVGAGAVAMAVAGLYQFLWSSLRDPLSARLGASEAATGTVFTFFILFQTVSQFPFGWVRDRDGPRRPLLAGAAFLAAGFGLTAVASSVPVSVLAAAVVGTGAGAAYTVAINTSVKWLDERRGLATGVISMAYSAGSFLAIPFVRKGLRTDFGATLLVLAAVSGVAVLATVPVLRDPGGTTLSTDGGDRSNNPSGTVEADRPGEPPDPARTDNADERDYTWRETVRTWQFWLLYGVFSVANIVSLMVIGKAVSFAQHLGLSAAVATGSATFIALGDAAGIIAGGALSDRFGRKHTVGLSLVCFGFSVALAVAAGTSGFGAAFVALIAASIFFRSPMFSVFPPLVGEYYGRTHSSTNYALLYSGKLWGGVGAGVVASLLVATVGWNATFLGGAVLAVLAGIATLFLRPVDPAT
jgi:OFA family oxalate/formate antiporter-like MFS transporter